MKKLLQVSCLLLLLCFIFPCVSAAKASEIPSVNPLLNPQKMPDYVETEHEYLNILLLGIDLGMDNYWGSGFKKDITECHTDAIMVVSIDKTDNILKLISLPRDSLTYIPGVYGIYKLNSAFNCATTVDEGISRVRSAATWLLGGIEIHRYCAVDMNTVILLGDAIGGVDFELEMNYTGHSGKKYAKGMQHLDGIGIMDYFRARTNATVNSNDIGRTNRQRELINAIIKKIAAQPTSLLNLLNLIEGEDKNIITDLSLKDIFDVSRLLMSFDMENTGSYVLTGKYRTALDGWNFTFTDQENRLSVLKETFGIEAQEIPYISHSYTKWLMDTGFKAVKYIRIANTIRDYAIENSVEIPEDFEDAYQAAINAFDQAALTMDEDSSRNVLEATKLLREKTEQLAKSAQYPDEIKWTIVDRWYTDPVVNEYAQIKWY